MEMKQMQPTITAQTTQQTERTPFDPTICFTCFGDYVEITAYRLVPQPGFEPGRHLATDFESALSTSSNIVA